MALPILDGNQTATTLSTVLTSGEHIPAHTVVSLGSVAISNITSAVSGSVVSVSNFPSTQTIAGTVTANAFGANQAGSLLRIPVAEAGDAQAETGVPIAANIGGGPQVVGDSYPLPISGTVTANAIIFNVEEGYDEAINQNVLAVHVKDLSGNVLGSSGNPLPISGTVTANVFGLDVPNGTIAQIPVHNYDEGFAAGNKAIPVLIGNENGGFNSSQPLPISGTVTANNPSGALTTRFGSVTTANTAQITSAVTNTSRKYLLAQNISAGTVTIGIGFSPTTTQGIQLTAGAGLTFDAFCPTGAVYWLGAVTGAAFTILEG